MGYHISRSSAKVIQENSVSEFYEYPNPFEYFSTGVSVIHGRYPGGGYAIDIGVDATWYVISGIGQITIGDDLYHVKTGDMIHVPKGSPFFIDGDNLELLVVSSPQWTFEQHKHIDKL